MPSVSQLVALATAITALAACSDSIEGGLVATIEVREANRVIAMDGTVSVSELVPTRVTVANIGNGQLVVDSIAIVSQPEGAFELLAGSSLPLTLESGASTELTLFFKSELGSADATAVVTIGTNRTSNSGSAFVFNVEPNVAGASLIAPSVIDFGVVPALQTRTKEMKLANVGSAPLSISRFFLSGHTGFSLTFGDTTYAASQAAATEGVALPEALTIQPGTSVDVQVNYTASGEEPAEGQVVLISNDASAEKGTTVQLYANVDGPCVKVSPATIDFGGKVVGQETPITMDIESCGDRALVVSQLELTNAGGGVFRFDETVMADGPLTIEPNERVSVEVYYLPTQIAPLVAGEPQADIGELVVHNDTVTDKVAVKLSGFGVDPTCPVAVITSEEPDEVLPQTLLHLSGRDSQSVTGITRYQWSVTQPSGSASVIRPDPNSPDITFEPNVVGTYKFTLRVFDSYNTQSCVDDEYTVIVTADGGIHVELLWDSPGDIVQTDEGLGAGTDIDLHFLHPLATGWFDPYYDAYFANPNPDWDTPSDRDDPSLDRDDTDGAGPENLNLQQPPAGNCYEIGAHYWDDWMFGASNATVRVYIYGQLRFNWDDVRMLPLDLWEVGNVCWPSGNVQAYGGGSPQILSNVEGGGGGAACDGYCDFEDALGFGCAADCGF